MIYTYVTIILWCGHTRRELLISTDGHLNGLQDKSYLFILCKYPLELNSVKEINTDKLNCSNCDKWVDDPRNVGTHLVLAIIHSSFSNT